MTTLIVSSSKMLRLTLIQFLLLLYAMPCFSLNMSQSCSDHKISINFELLHESVWEHVEVKNISSSSDSSSPGTTERHEYLFSPCKILKEHQSWSLYNHSQCAESYVCFVRSHVNGSVISAEGYGPSGSLNSNDNLHQMYLRAKDDTTAVPKSVAIAFSCDKHHGLGKPIKSFTSPSGTNFNWPTIVACENDSKMDFPLLTKCYVYDHEGNERDLSPLISNSGYKVVASPLALSPFAQLAATHIEKRSTIPGNPASGGLFINVCSESKLCAQKSTDHSSTQAQACYVNGSSMIPVGDVRDSSISFDEEGQEVILIYRTHVRQGSCSNLTTMIRFKCPHSAKGQVDTFNLLGSRQPFLMSSSPCEAIIQWDTDYACPTRSIEGNSNQCIVEDKATKRIIDLSPLKNITKIVNVTHDSEHHGRSTDQFVLRVCSTISPQDPIHKEYCAPHYDWNSVTACHKSEESNFTHIIGANSEAKLRYIDGQVQLIYPTRTGSCLHSPEAEASKPSIESPSPSTLITFVCNESAGLGEPKALPHNDSFHDCTYRFIWPTNLICHEENISYSHRLLTPCVASHNESDYDLSFLRRRHDQMLWRAGISHALREKHNLDHQTDIYINVCAGLSKLFRSQHNFTKDLPSNVAVVLTRGNSIIRSLGRDVSSPKWDNSSKSLILQYTESPSASDSITIRSKLIFECAPGVVDSSPFLERIEKTKNSEIYIFSWSNAAACPLKEYSGSDCQVHIPELGTVIDLNPLTQEEMFAHIITHGKYKYYMNICGNLTLSPCVTDKNNIHAGICQVERGGNRSWTLGLANKNLTYYNGLLSLTYEEGDKYNNKNSTPRSARVSFICSDEEKFELIEERDRIYFFRYFTKHACPRIVNMIPCLWSNGKDTIDLGRIAIHDDGQNHFDVSVSHPDTQRASTIYFVNVCRPLNPINTLASRTLPNGSAASAIVIYNGTESILSYGTPRRQPITLEDGRPALIYENGSPCGPANGTDRYSSLIIFLCDPVSFTPILKRNMSVPFDSCHQEFLIFTNETCGVFKPSPLPSEVDSFTGKSARPKSPSVIPPTVGPTKTSYRPFTSILLFVATALLVTVCLGLFLHSPSRNLVSSRLRTWVCGPITSSNPIHYSQVPTDSRCQLVPLKELNNEINADRVAFIPISSDSPYNPTTTLYDGDQASTNCISTNTVGSSKFSGPLLEFDSSSR